MDIVRKGGRYLVIGASEPRPVQMRATHFNLRQLTVAGTMSGDMPHYYRALTFLDDHQDRFSFGDLLGSRFGLDQVGDALAGME